ncbi:helix-turn-helix domain-containing protein [Paenibacillus polymyxa]|uniref:helix-turn-helix domain-containing protein n=1 Tax=Paenibacillus polymyxa TaxID=1406 RepID=UPI0001E6D518|nr:helix-turn-helix domain-containing protein [Paenibacillus polymyxa]WPQ59950.1 helix-turn-helix domain-containing protein [Paenibacillus polymyxa]
MKTDEKMNKSEQIRRLFDAGMSVSEIAEYMGVRYQFAYNVVSYHLKQKEKKTL